MMGITHNMLRSAPTDHGHNTSPQRTLTSRQTVEGLDGDLPNSLVSCAVSFSWGVSLTQEFIIAWKHQVVWRKALSTNSNTRILKPDVLITTSSSFLLSRNHYPTLAEMQHIQPYFWIHHDLNVQFLCNPAKEPLARCDPHHKQARLDKQKHTRHKLSVMPFGRHGQQILNRFRELVFNIFSFHRDEKDLQGSVVSQQS